jgi:hypothetical protein
MGAAIIRTRGAGEGLLRKGYLKNQAPYSIIYSESESDTSSDLPSVEMFKE